MNALRDLTHGSSKPNQNSNGGMNEIERPGNFNPDLGFAPSSSNGARTNASGYANGAAGDVRSHASASNHDALAQDLPTIIPDATPETIAASSAPAASRAQAASSRSAYARTAPAEAPRANAAPAHTAPAEQAPKRSFLGGRRSAPKKKGTSEKDLQRLRRVDLLELLVDQIRENDYLTTENAQLSELTERLKAKLDQKDAQIEHLKQRLNMKDDEISRLEERNRLIAHASGLIDVAELVAVEEVAVDRYLKQLGNQGSHSATDPYPQR